MAAVEWKGATHVANLVTDIYFSKSLAIWTGILLLIFGLGLLIFVYFQGGVDAAIHLGGWACLRELAPSLRA